MKRLLLPLIFSFACLFSQTRDNGLVATSEKLTESEARLLLEEDVGRWKVKVTEKAVGKDPITFDDVMVARWEIKGKILRYDFNPLVNGERISVRGYKEYDAEKGVFIWRAKAEGKPENVEHQSYDKSTKSLTGEITYPNGVKSKATWLKLNKNETKGSIVLVFENKVLATQELVFKRIPKETLPLSAPMEKLTEKEARLLMESEVGKWKRKVTERFAGRPSITYDDVSLVRWEVNGRILRYEFNPLVNGERVPVTAFFQYDPEEGVFNWLAKREGIPDFEERLSYDKSAKTFHGTKTFPDGAKSKSTYLMASKDEWRGISVVVFERKVVYMMEIISKRLPKKATRRPDTDF